MSENEQIWKEFKLIITDPPRYSGHFGLIKNKLIPFVERNLFSFWITNYHNAHDYMLFRVKCLESQLEDIREFLDSLKMEGAIVNWQETNWSPSDDARARIEGLRRLRNFDPNAYAIVGFSNGEIIVMEDANVQERHKQLTALFESLGECTKAIYKHLDNKPKDLWIISVFVHLLLNSLDFSGPGPQSEEDMIRKIPPF